MSGKRYGMVFKKKNENLQSPIDYPDLYSLDLILDLVTYRNASQIEQADKIDTKAYSIITSATALVSAALVIQAVLPKTHLPLFYEVVQVTPLILLLLAYLASMVTSIFAYIVRTYKQSPDPTTLYSNYIKKSERVTKANVLRSKIDDFQQNEIILDRKIKWNKISFMLFLAQTTLFVIFLALHTLV